MSWWVAGATVVSGFMGSQAAGDAADAQLQGSRESTAAQERMFDKQTALQEPWRKAGETALNKLIPLTDYEPFSYDEFTKDPGYAFRLSEGSKALDRQAAARGGLISGSALKGALRFGQEMGSQEYTNAFNRYQTERTARLQPLQSLAGVGQTSANTLSNAAGALGAAESANAIGAGNARASSYVGQANAMSQGLGSYLNYSQNQNLINSLAQNRYAPNYGQYTPGSGAFVGPMPS